MNTIDWVDPSCPVSTNFNVKDCLWLPTWSRLANESDGLSDDIKNNLINLCAKMEGVRVYLGNKPINVHCMFRPIMYNKIIGGATHSAHLTGNAIDFHFDEMNTNQGCDMVRGTLLPKLEEFELRMENVSKKSERNWIHLDNMLPNPNRYFFP